MKAQDVLLGEKEYLNPQEAIMYWDLSNRKFYDFLKKGPYMFVAYYGQRKLILREAFTAYLKRNPDVREELKNGRSRTGKKRQQAQSTISW